LLGKQEEKQISTQDFDWLPAISGGRIGCGRISEKDEFDGRIPWDSSASKFFLHQIHPIRIPDAGLLGDPMGFAQVNHSNHE
jgi:hypothetical protein